MSHVPTFHLPYPSIEPFSSGSLSVGDGHYVYYEECGNPNGRPVVFLHGGPGSGCSALHRRLFNPDLCRIILFDQRGCGRSMPRGRLYANSSAHLVSDIEKLRSHLKISQWLVTGGSWGAGLALAYATTHPSACLGLILRSVFLGRTSDINWFFDDAKHLLPDAWSALSEGIPLDESDNLLLCLSNGLKSTSESIQWQFARRWQAWEASLTQRQFIAVPDVGLEDEQTKKIIEKYQLQSQYLLNACYWKEQPLLQRLTSIEHLPVTIMHGRLDWICRPSSAWDLHQRLPNSQLHWLDTCGHGPYELAIAECFAKSITHFYQNLASAPK